MLSVCSSFGDGTFAGKQGNGEDAPKAAARGVIIDPPEVPTLRIPVNTSLPGARLVGGAVPQVGGEESPHFPPGVGGGRLVVFEPMAKAADAGLQLREV